MAAHLVESLATGVLYGKTLFVGNLVRLLFNAGHPGCLVISDMNNSQPLDHLIYVDPSKPDSLVPGSCSPLRPLWPITQLLTTTFNKLYGSIEIGTTTSHCGATANRQNGFRSSMGSTENLIIASA